MTLLRLRCLDGTDVPSLASPALPGWVTPPSVTPFPRDVNTDVGSFPGLSPFPKTWLFSPAKSSHHHKYLQSLP